MSREILFKGKYKKHDLWVEGDLVHYETGEMAIFEEKFSRYGSEATEMQKRVEVDPETICQYTGLTDRNGKKIFEGDIVEIAGEDGYFEVNWDNHSARFSMDGEGIVVDFDNYYGYETEVVGNKFDNPELLNKEG